MSRKLGKLTEWGFYAPLSGILDFEQFITKTPIPYTKWTYRTDETDEGKYVQVIIVQETKRRYLVQIIEYKPSIIAPASPLKEVTKTTLRQAMVVATEIARDWRMQNLPINNTVLCPDCNVPLKYEEIEIVTRHANIDKDGIIHIEAMRTILSGSRTQYLFCPSCQLRYPLITVYDMGKGRLYVESVDFNKWNSLSPV